MRFNKSLAVAGALGLAVLTAGPALAEPAPTDTPTAPVQTKTPETPAKTPEPKPTKTAQQPKQTAKPTPTATQTQTQTQRIGRYVRASITPSVKPGGRVNYSVTADPRATDVKISSRAFSGVHTVALQGGRANGDAATWDDVKPGRYPVTFEVTRNGQHVASTVRTLTVVAAEAPAIEPRFGLSTYTAKAGAQITADVVGDLRAGEVIFSSDLFGTKHLQLKDIGEGRGRATITFTVPAGTKADSYAVRADLGRFGKPTANLKIEGQAPITDASIEVSPNAVNPGERVTYKVWSREPRATDARISSEAFSGVHTVVLRRGQATSTAATWDNVKPGRYPVKVEILLGGSVIGTAQTTLTIKDSSKPVPVTGLSLELEPNRVLPGQSYFAGVTTKNVKPGTVVTIKDPGGKRHTARLDAWGTAGVRLSAPKGTDPGRYTVVASLPSGQSSSARLTVVRSEPKPRINLVLVPNKLYAGGNFAAFVATPYQGRGTYATLIDPAGKRFHVKISKSGVGMKQLHVPAGSKPGDYWFAAQLPNGAKDWAKLTVKPRYRTSSLGYTPLGGAETGGGLAASGPGSSLGGVALGGLLITGGAGTAPFGRRRKSES